MRPKVDQPTDLACFQHIKCNLCHNASPLCTGNCGCALGVQHSGMYSEVQIIFVVQIPVTRISLNELVRSSISKPSSGSAAIARECAPVFPVDLSFQLFDFGHTCSPTYAVSKHGQAWRAPVSSAEYLTQQGYTRTEEGAGILDVCNIVRVT